MRVLREVVTALKLPAWLKTSGSKGYHIALPMEARVATVGDLWKDLA